MKKSWGLIPKIISGEKIIESRWYKNKSVPWGKIFVGDTIYFKNSGEPIIVEAKVLKVISLENIKPIEILKKYGTDDGIEPDKLNYFANLFKDKKYCLLIYLRDVKRIEPFEVNKKGFGSMSAWITIDDIRKIRI